MPGTDPPDLPERQLRDWMLCLLRFAITQAAEDQGASLVLAGELDMQNGAGQSTFFQRTSVAVCQAIMMRDEDARRILRQHISRIEEPRLKDAFAAAAGIETFVSARQHRKPGGRSRSLLLWRGLRNP
jgi:hypothetical protein